MASSGGTCPGAVRGAEADHRGLLPAESAKQAIVVDAYEQDTVARGRWHRSSGGGQGCAVVLCYWTNLTEITQAEPPFSIQLDSVMTTCSL